MMEQLDYVGQEEYIWAMRTRTYVDDNDDWKDRRFSEDSKLSITSNKSGSTTGDEHNIKVMASLVPDEIIANCNDYSHRNYDVCLLFGDVSGFTDLCEKYNKTGKGGPSRLTHVLNAYIGTMVQEIMSYNGDVLKFSGDAFLAMWKSGVNDSMQDCIHQAVDCALVIQKTHGKYETDVGVFLRVKLAISAGFVVFSIIGDQHDSHYIVIGQPIFDVKSAEKKSVAGDVMICHTAWNYLNPSEYLYEYMEDGIHIKVMGLGANWRSTQKSYKHQKQLDEDESNTKTEIGNDTFSIRPMVNEAVKMNLKEHLRKYIIKPVMRGIDMNEPLEYLTEMRQITILFMNVVITKIKIDDFVDLVDTCYKYVCKISNSMEGCVNKVSLFDKDLMFVVIFGLRGFKHELNCQVGLRCATLMFEKINSLPDVKTTSIGVTTGITYCGVVGHTLRREYTVISLTVNKAARLMCAYTNKVTCDRETFLHSKLQASNFILQEYKTLKGITKTGPVYEFRESHYIKAEGEEINKYPLLGRDEHLILYLKMIQSAEELYKRRQTGFHDGLRTYSHHNTLIISGDARQGKCRLLDELVYLNPKNIPMTVVKLHTSDHKVPFRGIQLYFSGPLGITAKCSAKEREIRLLSRLRNMKVPELLCLLNPIFHVDFEKTALFNSLTAAQKKLATGKMIKQLCYGCFSSFWVVALRKVQYMDNESWAYLQEIIETDVSFTVLTIYKPCINSLTESAKKVLNNHYSRLINLGPIDKWFHAGLACQILDIQAIPVDLEKVIQTRSNGNPGWIESFLVSLVQGGGIVIVDTTFADIKDLGLIVPPNAVFTRKTPAALRAELLAADNRNRGTDGKWRMYDFNYEEAEEKGSLYASSLDLMSNIWQICVINKNENIYDVDAEWSLDVLILKTYDALSSYQQLLLKCSAVIGDTIPRDMLNYVMNCMDMRTTALAVKALFEIKVLYCARGDFTQGDMMMAFEARLLPPSRFTTVKCDCKGIRPYEACKDLPKYASCGMFKFSLDAFRESTYNLLTDCQRKEFHARAARYLEKETRKCKSCGNSFFIRVLGVRYDDGMKKKAKQVKVKRDVRAVDAMMTRKVSMSPGSSTTGEVRSLNWSNYSDGSSIRSGLLRRSSEILRRNKLGMKIIKILRYRPSLTKTFSYADFTHCQCPQILSAMYYQLIQHCEGADIRSKLMDALLEYAYLCILSFNVPQALKILKRATNFLETTYKECTEEGADWQIPLTRARIGTLYAKCQLDLGNTNEAKDQFLKAMKDYGIPFPVRKNEIRMKTQRLNLKQNFSLFCIMRPFIVKQGYEAEFCDDVSNCLAIMCNLYMDLNMWEHAELAALMSLQKALESNMDFYILCNAYANMLQIANHKGNRTISIALEVHALRMCHRKKSNVEPQELKGVCKLYGVIFCSRFLRSELEHSIDLAFIMLRISSTLNAAPYSLKVMVLLVQALLMRKRLMEAVTILFEMEYYAAEDIDNSGRIWYYALCVGVQIETGYCVIPYLECEKIYHIEGEVMSTVRDMEAVTRYFTVLWLWAIRTGDYEKALIWQTKLQEFSIGGKSYDSLANIYTALYFLEGLLIFMVGKLNSRNVRAVSQAFQEIKILLNNLERSSRVVSVIAPRYYHLKAFYKYIRYQENAAFSLLHKAKILSVKLENVLEELWCDHSEKAWTNSLSSILTDFWNEHAEPGGEIDYHEIENDDGKIGYYTLPTPIYL
ncbi:adenylate cyclase type 10-like [Onthophagus taurus]|uniref:adenylate cyclase type 10-like n=1 Tax=Onthophagus taurus TaxID=166361 RepID=UPI000C2080C2|nr:adenylate cyclase type 10-like [Onthophagus taurus]